MKKLIICVVFLYWPKSVCLLKNYTNCDFYHGLNKHADFIKKKYGGVEGEQLNLRAGESIPYDGCGFCCLTQCDPIESIASGCKKSFKSEVLHWQFDIFEFGIHGSFSPKEGFAKIKLNEKYFLKVEMLIDKANNNGTIVFNECSDERLFQVCYQTHIYRNENFDVEYGCLFFGIGFMKNNRMNLYASTKSECDDIPSSHFSLKNVDNPTLKYFNFDIDKMMDITFEFFYDEDFLYHGVLVYLPCSPGGYTFNQLTGFVISGNTCASRYNKSHDKTYPETGIEYIIREYLNGDEDYYFPPLNTKKKNVDIRSPLYFSSAGMLVEPEDLLPIKQRNPYKKDNQERKGCFYYNKTPTSTEAPTEITPPPSTTTTFSTAATNASKSTTELKRVATTAASKAVKKESSTTPDFKHFSRTSQNLRKTLAPLTIKGKKEEIDEDDNEDDIDIEDDLSFPDDDDTLMNIIDFGSDEAAPKISGRAVQKEKKKKKQKDYLSSDMIGDVAEAKSTTLHTDYMKFFMLLVWIQV